MDFNARADELKNRLNRLELDTFYSRFFTVSCDLCGSTLLNHSGKPVAVESAREAFYVGEHWGWRMSDGGKHAVCIQCVKPHRELKVFPEVDTSKFKRVSLNQINAKLERTQKRLEDHVIPYRLGIIEPDVWD